MNKVKCPIEAEIFRLAEEGRSMTYAARKLGYTRHTFSYIIARLGVKFLGKNQVKVHGFVGTLPEVCEHFNLGIEAATLYSRMRDKGLTLEEAVLIPRCGRKQNGYEYRGVKGTIRHIVTTLELPLTVKQIKDRITRGMSCEQAFSLPLRKVTCPKKKPRLSSNVPSSSTLHRSSSTSSATSTMQSAM